LEAGFVDFNLNPERRDQYLKLKPILDNIWEANLKVYGEPVWTVEEKEARK
jgi:hypothetical protein